MKKLTALLLAIVLAISLCTIISVADDESATIVLVPEDETLLTAEGLALFFVDRDAVKEETETSVSWYKETTKDGKSERELVEEMPLIIKITAVGPRIFTADGYIPSLKLVDLVAAYAPEKDPDSEHTYGWHRIFNQDCRWRGLRYGTCKDCFGIEFDLANGNHTYEDGSCIICGSLLTPAATPAPTAEPTADPTTAPTEDPCDHEFGNYIDNTDNHYRACSKCGYEEISNHDDPEACTYDEDSHRFYCQTCQHTFIEGEHEFGDIIVERDDEGHKLIYAECRICGYRNFNVPS